MTHRMYHILACLLLILAVAAVVSAQETTPEATDDLPAATEEAPAPADNDNLPLVDDDIEVAIEPTGNNGYCTICHNQPLRTTRLGDGTILNLYVNPEMVIASVHGPDEDSPGLGCLDCHEDSFPHNGPTPPDGRRFTLDKNSLCTSCHVEQSEVLADGLHAQAIESGNLEAAVCTDCHDAHHIQSAEAFPDLVAGVCGDCHDSTFDEWRISPHADIGPLGCASCHSYHAQTLRVGTNSTELCLNCHGEGEMEPLFAHDTHLNVANSVDCVECHMHAITVEDQPISLNEPMSTGHSMFLDTVPCTTCHAELEASGEWEQIISTRYEITVPETAEQPDDETPTEPAGDPNSIFVIQGLLLGLGLGITFTIVFVTRSLRRSNNATDTE